MKTACGVGVVLFLLATGAQAWNGPSNNKSVSDLEQMSDEQLLAEAVGPCLAAGDSGPAALEYLRTIAQVARKRHNDEPQPAFIDMLVAAAAESPTQCRKVQKAGLKPVGEQKARAVAQPASAGDIDEEDSE